VVVTCNFVRLSHGQSVTFVRDSVSQSYKSQPQVTSSQHLFTASLLNNWRSLEAGMR